MTLWATGSHLHPRFWLRPRNGATREEEKRPTTWVNLGHFKVTFGFYG